MKGKIEFFCYLENSFTNIVFWTVLYADGDYDLFVLISREMS